MRLISSHKPTTGAFFWFRGVYYRSHMVYAGLPDLVLVQLFQHTSKYLANTLGRLRQKEGASN